jgi:hypothetical protein
MRVSTTFAAIAAVAAVGSAGTAPSAVASAPTAEQQHVFPVLRGTPETVVGSAVSQFIRSADGRRAGVDAANVHRLVAPDGGTWSVLSGEDRVCLVLENHENVATCASDADAAAGRLGVLLIDPRPGGSATDGPATQVGLAPIGVVSGTARLDGAGETGVRVDGNGAYVVRSGSPAQRLVLHRRHHKSLLYGAKWNGGRSRPAPIARAATSWDYIGNANGQTFTDGGLYTAVHPIVAEYVASADSNWLCGNTVNGDGSWAGTTFCTTSFSPATSHPYNGSSRRGWAGNGTAGVPTLGIAYVAY